jgi:TPR repeat protein
MHIRPRFRATLLTLPLLAALAAPAFAAQNVVPPDPTEDPMLITAGFLDHHQDMKYRLLGLEAYNEKRYDDAMRFFRRASFFADKPSQGMVAEMYWNGQGVARDPALAYAWMDLAAERGYVGFIALRERYWKDLSASDRDRAVQEGQAIYAKFGDAAAKPRYEFQLRVGKREMTGSRTGFNRGVQIEIPGPSG